MVTLTWSQVCARRLSRHGLAADPFGTPAEAVTAMCGAHAQVPSAAEVSVGIRVGGITRQHVRDALWEERSLVRTFGPRGTVHLLPAADLPLWTGALGAVPAGASPFQPDVRMSAGQVDEVVAAIAHILLDAELTVDELDAAIVDRVGTWAGDPVMPAFQTMWPRWRQVVNTAAHRGALCFGPSRGRKVTYTSPQRWLPGFSPADPAASVAWLVTSYLHAYGPATQQQFAKWLSAPRTWAGQVFEKLAADSAIEPVTVDGEAGWVVAGDTGAPDLPPAGVRLLPYFEAYTIGSFPRERVFPGAAAERALNGGQAGNYPVLLVDGVAAGVWHQKRSGRRIVVTVEPVGRLTKAQQAELAAQVERVGEILEGRPEWTIGTVTVGPHA